jgi:hypothetical protein
MSVKKIFQGLKVILDKESYSVLKLERIPESMEGIFALIIDRKEKTAVVKDAMLPRLTLKYSKRERGYELLTFNTVLPFTLVGFIATIAKALASKGISILTFSSFSTDHMLVKKEKIKDAIRALEKLGCRVERA